ncbi:phosphatase PAP2 family protein [Microbacterium sp. A196]|uniref:phosphatase PAP2 family protein n=1 Tax=unclassified Microbacterium TaxID=2609290 RepID=UPI003FCF7675
MTHRVLLWWGVGAILAAMAIGVLVTGDGSDAPAIDLGWNAVMGDIRNPFLIGFGSVMDRVGGGWIATLLIPLAILAALLLARRWKAAVLVAVTLLASVGAVQLLKSLFGRTRPQDMLVTSDFGSFPSGHTANAATIAALAVLLFPRLWVLIVAAAWTLAMAFSRTLVSAHWLSDTVGGVLVGIGVTLVLGGFLLEWTRPGRKEGRFEAGEAAEIAT